MDLSQFHQDLLGRQPTEQQAKLYRLGARNVPETDPESITAAIVLALWQVKTGGQTYILVPTDLEESLVEQLKGVFRHCVRLRKDQPAGLKALKAAFGELAFGHKLWTIEQPARWVAVGWTDRVPEWFSARLQARPGV